MSDLVERRKICGECGAEFVLSYNRKTGEAQQSFPVPCGPETECFKRNMPLSDFKPNCAPQLIGA